MAHSPVAALGLSLTMAGLLALGACSSSNAGTEPAPGAGGAGAGGAGAGAGGTAGAAPPPPKVDKVDLLLLIDNSASMADKQQILADAVPDLVQRLVNPACVDGQGAPVAQQPSKPMDACSAGSSREFNAVFDIHVGVITSSVGGHGADSCSNTQMAQYNPRMEDMAHLSAREPGDPSQSVPTWQSKGFLYWDPTQSATPPGDTDIPGFVDKFRRVVLGAGQDGCGFEAPLEAWYRFLVDPAPYQAMVPVDCATKAPTPGGNCRGGTGVDATVLQQRKDFVRQDSLLAIVMLTDEDDCSVADDGTGEALGQGFLVAQAYSGSSPFHLPRATSACKTDPKSEACMSCAQAAADPNDPECAKGPYSGAEDSLNLRCYRQKQRFGLDFLYPTGRYVEALTKPSLPDGTVNPLFCAVPTSDAKGCSAPMRHPGNVLLAGIVGVPWQDLARDPNDLGKGYKTAPELDWAMIVGDLNNFVEPTDPLMVQSVEPRSGTNPATGQPLAPPSASSPQAINGHEWNILNRDDLQYACVFTLPTPRECTGNVLSCDCYEADLFPFNNPLCQDGSGYGTVQFRAKAYPAARLLTVLKGLGPRAAVASICAGNTTAPELPDFGYRPAIAAIIERMRPSL